MNILRITQPTVVEFEYRGDMRGRTPTPSHEVRIMRRYPPQSTNPAEMWFLGCDCPRSVRSDGWLTVWHAPGCAEVDRDGP